jgi:hypothetical protein
MSSSLNIKIPLTQSLLIPAEKWVKSLNSGDFCQMTDAKVDGNFLIANAFDLCELVNISSEDDASELDLRRFKKLAIKALEEVIERTKNPSKKANMAMALDWLRNAFSGQEKDAIPYTMPRKIHTVH